MFISKLQVEGYKNTKSIIHFIGDLNQAIYSFKDSTPLYLEKQLLDNHFDSYELKNNFRSHQNIVDVACTLQGIKGDIIISVAIIVAAIVSVFTYSG